MPTIKKSEGSYTLRNVKGNELTISNSAEVTSLRFRNKKFENIYLVNQTQNSSDKIWDAESITEGLVLKNGDSELTYSISNDNEVSIKAKNQQTEINFNLGAISAPKITVDSEEFKGESTGTFKIIDKPAVVEMELGMFGFDIGCPIDWLNAGLKNAATIISEEAKIQIKVYTSAESIEIKEIEKTLKLSIPGTSNGIQTIFALKNL